jgi:hypothetical protein
MCSLLRTLALNLQTSSCTDVALNRVEV